MKLTTNIKSRVKPDLKEFTETAVYVRKNINTYIDTDPVFNKENIMYTYDEYEYTIAEWVALTDERLFKTLSALIEKGLLDDSVFDSILINEEV